MEILALVGSPRRLGNSELMAKEISRGIPEPHRLKLVRLPEMHIGACRACYTCLFDDRTCPQEDDFPPILDALIRADAIILSVPTYLLAANASLKQFLDRGLSLLDRFEELWGKPAVGVTIAGIPGMEGYTKLCVDSALRLIGAQLKGSEVVYGALPGEVFMSETNRNIARRLAKALFRPPPDWQREPWRCQACGGDTFRFLGPDQIRCMTCSSPGKVRTDEGHISFSVDPPEDHFFLSLQGARHHVRWLQAMKQRFAEKKKDLKRICLEYLRDGEWLEPRRKTERAKTDS
ncbi:MAG: flavodoxin family protein [Deltaproteobacteria bacterium]|nr:MAG: flavodoxin family protein [Deltaproteobacteria bacterium]